MPKSPPLPGLPLSWTMLSVFPRTKLLVAAVVGIVAAVDCSSGEPNTAWEKETATFRANRGLFVSFHFVNNSRRVLIRSNFRVEGNTPKTSLGGRTTQLLNSYGRG